MRNVASAGQVRIDRVGLTPAAALFTLGPFDLDDGQPGRVQCPGQPDAVGPGALQPDHHARAGTVFGDPGDRRGEPVRIVAHRHRRDGDAAGADEFQGVCVGVRVATDHSIDNICQHGHCVSDLLLGTGS